VLLGSAAACASDNPLFGLDPDATSDGSGTGRDDHGTESSADETAEDDDDDNDSADNDSADNVDADDDTDDDADTGDMPGCVTIVLSATEDAFVVGNSAGKGGACMGETCLNNYGHTDRRAVFEDGAEGSYLLARFNTNPLGDLIEVSDVRVAVQLGEIISNTAKLRVHRFDNGSWEEGTSNGQPGEGQACWVHETDGEPWTPTSAEFGSALGPEVGSLDLTETPESPTIPLGLGDLGWIDSGFLSVAITANMPTQIFAKGNPDDPMVMDRVQLVVDGCE